MDSNHAGPEKQTQQKVNSMSLANKALLVKLSVGLPGNTRTDVKITSDTISAHGMAANSGRWLKQLYPDEAIKPLTVLQGEIRTYHYEHTLPWSDEGYRILPTAHHAEYTDKMRQFRAKFEAVRDNFCSRLEDWIDWARIAHNGTFDGSIYPTSPEALARKFNLSLDFSPVPSGDDFRCCIDQSELDIMAQQVNQRVSEATEAARSDLWQRLVQPLRNMVARLSDPDAIFRDSLIGNLRDIAALIPDLNVTSDPALSAFASEVASSLAQLKPETLRSSKVDRAETARKASEILKRMVGYLPVN